MLIYGEGHNGYDAAYERDHARRAAEAAKWAEQLSMAERWAADPTMPEGIRKAAAGVAQEMAKGDPLA